MERLSCTICHKNKTTLQCDLCAVVCCKNCAEFIDEDQVEFIDLLPEDLINQTFCLNCYNQGIDERLNHFRKIAEAAKTVDIYTKLQTKETRRIKRLASPIQVSNCNDDSEVLLRLAFIAAEKGFSTLVDVDIYSKKVGEGKSYRKRVWFGRGTPVNPMIKK